jgi:hypothetical protein
MSTSSERTGSERTGSGSSTLYESPFERTEDMVSVEKKDKVFSPFFDLPMSPVNPQG